MMSLGQILTKEQIDTAVDFLVKGDDKGLKNYLATFKEELERNGVVDTYLYYVLQHQKPMILFMTLPGRHINTVFGFIEEGNLKGMRDYLVSIKALLDEKNIGLNDLCYFLEAIEPIEVAPPMSFCLN